MVAFFDKSGSLHRTLFATFFCNQGEKVLSVFRLLHENNIRDHGAFSICLRRPFPYA